jgi:hypothetical protein
MPHQLLRQVLERAVKANLRQHRPSYKLSLRFTNHAPVSQTLTTFYCDGVFGSYAGYAGKSTCRSSEQPGPAATGGVHRVEVQMNEFGRLLESEIPRLRTLRSRLDPKPGKSRPLVQTLSPRARKAASLAARLKTSVTGYSPFCTINM